LTPPLLDVVLRQEDTDRSALRGKTVVLIDVLRATSTLVAAFAAGAAEAWCYRTVREVFRARRRLPAIPQAISRLSDAPDARC